MIGVKVMEYWLVMHDFEMEEVHFEDSRKDFTYSGIGLVGVAFVESFVD